MLTPANIQLYLSCAGAFLLAAKPLVVGMESAADLLHGYAVSSHSAKGEALSARAQAILHGVANVLDFAAAYLPHATMKGAGK